MSAQDNGGPAFPTPALEDRDTHEFLHSATAGMSLRDWFAGKALPAVYAAHMPNVHISHGVPDALTLVADVSYAMADAMIKARQS